MDAGSTLRVLNFRSLSISVLNRRPLLRSTLTSQSLNHYNLSKVPSSMIRLFPLCYSVSCASKRGDTDYCSNGTINDVPSNKLLQVVLVSPQIPGNTGCIARTCAASAVGLHLVEPLGYKIDDTKLKRAGLDYWPFVVVKVHASWDDFREYFMEQDGENRLIAFTKRGTKFHSDFKYKKGDWLVFGSETSGLPDEALLDCTTEGIGGGTLKIPMVDTYVRCLNLSVSVGIALYEASRQLNYQQIHMPPDTSVENGKLFISEDIFG